MRKKIVAGNWKMNNTLDETKKLIKELKKEIKGVKLKGKRVLIAPTFVNLQPAVKKIKKSKIEVIAQNMHQAKNGAFTGEISADMLTDIGVKTVIIGHSERREYFGETDAILAEKVDAALSNNLEVVFCFGEKWEDRKAGNHFKVIEAQLKNALFHLEAGSFKNIILAYEPVWAIGTGQTASADQAQEMHAFIRSLIEKKYNNETADAISILYGGSVKPNNAEEIFSKPDVDGGLIGGASLKAKDFTAIIKAI
ncbi:triosephosphate isomerase [Tenacibaculum adriaticum]|uniref:Triosephosphate isomerase n=1 Tax=Tenacibaculum adriaticum TaxID=413713 RepID=A0A5S5DPX9_9FLAO|nr:triose-phosphate isomerase [Tenacibaculum adriaticum]TYP97957.1 triosephosphate isomerase [Tenacibaculum adriaticum]